MTKKANIIFFIPDSYRADVLGHRGNKGAVTPNLDALVEFDAVSFINTFSQNPVCTPSRCSFMTGWYPHVTGHRSMRNMLKEYEPNLLKTLRKEGYYTWWGGRNDLLAVEKKEDYLKHCDVRFSHQGKYKKYMKHSTIRALSEEDPLNGAYYKGVFPRNNDAEKYYDYDTGNVLGAIDMIKNWDSEQAFFCYLPLSNPHPPYCVEEEYYNMINKDSLPSRVSTPSKDANLLKVLDDLRKEYKSEAVTEEMWQEVKHVYYAMCCKIDSLFGKLVDALRTKGLYDNTWIFFFSDHGDFTGDYSLPEKTHLTLQDSLLNVPLIIKPPKNIPLKPGKRTHLTELLDITATLYDMLEIKPNYSFQGKSLRKSIFGENSEIHDAVFAEVGSRKDDKAFVNSDVNNLPSNSFYARQSRVAVPCHKEGSYAVMCRTQDYKYVRRYYTDHHELFDLKADPNETKNIIGDTKYQDIKNKMQTKLLDFFLRTADVLPHKTDSRQV